MTNVTYLQDPVAGIFQGDVNGDRRIDVRDVDEMCRTLNRSRTGLDVTGRNNVNLLILNFDLDGNVGVDQRDLDFLVSNILRTKLGDVNLDGRFDSADLIAVFQSGKYEQEGSPDRLWTEGDWNCDGVFDSSDLVAAFARGEFERVPN